MSRVLLDECLPGWEFRELHRRLVAAPPERVWDTLVTLRGSDVRLTRALMAIRALPARLAGGRYRLMDAREDRSLLDGFLANGFLVLGRGPDEMVLGAVGRFWRPRGGGLVSLADADQFARFAEPGFAKAVVNFRTAATGQGTLLSTETRVLATDERTRRVFGLYWTIIRLGSGLIRRDILAATAARAERAS
jgi:hypothetical protein